HGLNIPTTRSLSVTTTGENVYRETGQLAGAILTRVAASHIRVGTFEYLAMKGNFDNTKILVDYALNRHYPNATNKDTPALSLLTEVMEKQIDLVINWLRVGFIHGVMNTDNMTISGETIDYGPCAFMDSYNNETVFSSIDHMGRYAFGNQPHIVKWNLTRFAETLLPILNSDKNQAVAIATQTIDSYDEKLKTKQLSMMRKKLGLFGEELNDESLISELLTLMEQNQADYTNTFRYLLAEKVPHENIFDNENFKSWQQKWQQRRTKNTSSIDNSDKLLKTNNPAVIPRNHKVEEALSAACDNGDLTPLNDLLAVIKNPYESKPQNSPFQYPPIKGESEYQTFCGT
ncbi:MAG: YdiU family protein, partial [Magnetococcales bacterium]|nr:YdiU family protein [Magnetococcales bacterium]